MIVRVGATCRAVMMAVTAALSWSPFAAAAADDWETIVAAAKKEGVVVVHGAPGTSYRTAMVTAFNAAYPDIKVQFSGAAGAVEIPKVVRERQAGIFAWDVWVGGPTGALGQLKDIGFYQPLAPALQPEIMTDDKWTGGFAAGWMDLERKIYYAFDGTIQNPVLVNWDVVSKTSFRTLEDLLKPEFAGKVVWHDPRLTGTGNGTSQTLFHNLGKDGLIVLYKNKVVYTSNSQQIAEWIVRGRYPIAIGLEPNTLNEFQGQGIGMNVAPLPASYYKIQQISVGFGGIGLIDRAPHINAAKVYINWLLSKQGQEAWVKVPRNSRRTDVVPAFAELTPIQGRDYFIGQAEEFTEERQDLLKVAKEAIDGSPR